MKFSEFLERRYLRWQTEAEERKTTIEFADWLGFKQSTVSMWMNGRSTPRDVVMIKQLAQRLGLEVYDVLGMDRPDPDLARIDQLWDDLSPAQKRAIREQAEDYAAGHERRNKKK